MTKIKTKRSFNKRFKKTASGKIKYKKSCFRHILTKKTTKRKRHARQKSLISKFHLSMINKCLPYI